MEAFIIIDMQESYIGHRRGTEEFNSVIEHINYVATLFRDADRPVIIVRDLAEGDGKEYDNVKEINVSALDHEIVKYKSNSFWETSLDTILSENDVDFLVLAGNAAEYCVTATYFGAQERGYQTVLLQNGVLAVSKNGLKSLNEVRPLISHTAIKHLLNS